MSFATTPQIIGLVRGEPKPGQRHRANGKAIIGEMGSERISASETLDRTLSSHNIYDGETSSGYATWDAMERTANEYKTTFVDKKGREHSRSLKSDAVVGFAVIFNPPYEVCKDWTDEQYQKFYDDSWEILCEIEPRVFSDKNVRLTAEHWDEGVKDDSGKFDRHQHRAGEARDADGKYCGNLIDAKLLATINKKYPKMMRDRGWDMADLDTTDWEKYKTDDDYKAERKAKWKQSGKSVNAHIKSKLDSQLQESAEMVEQAKKLTDDVRQFTTDKRNELRQQENKIRDERIDLHNERNKFSREKNEWDMTEKRLRRQIKASQEQLQKDRDRFEAEKAEFESIKAMLMEQARMEANDYLQQQFNRIGDISDEIEDVPGYRKFMEGLLLNGRTVWDMYQDKVSRIRKNNRMAQEKLMNIATEYNRTKSDVHGLQR